LARDDRLARLAEPLCQREEGGVAVALAARAGNRRFWRLSALRAHTKAPYKTDLNRKTLRALKRPGRPGQEAVARARPGAVHEAELPPHRLAVNDLG
jgi:hypothetical protein